ncbi:MAG TPA: twin-arginine translocase TatA/TatE family subunit [Bryobacteraceae bacterium]|nr:twin-arginine translocase TatA/TatE family subunit [Bryobacteraceae bacterium]
MVPDGIQTAGVGGLGFQELLLIVLAAVVLFGGKKMADLGKGLGEGIRNFKTALKGDEQPTEEVKRDEVEAKR